MLKVLKKVLIFSTILVTFSGCNMQDIFTNETNLPKSLTGTWEGTIEVTRWLTYEKEKVNIRIHINLTDKPYFLNIKTHGREVDKTDIDKFIVHQKDNTVEYFDESGDSIYLVLVDDKNVQLKMNKTIALKKILSTY